jgi:hypothetical protein
MPEPSPFSALIAGLAERAQQLSPKPSPLLSVLVVILASVALAPLAVLLAWNALAPLLHAPSMTYAEAAGAVAFYLMLVATIAFLKE